MNNLLKAMGWKDEYGKWDFKEIGVDLSAIFAVAMIIVFVMAVC